MTTPRLDIDLDAVASNTRALVGRLAPKGIRVTGVTKASLGSPGVAAAMLRGGASGIGDSRVENLSRLRADAIDAPLTLIRSPSLSRIDAVVRAADLSLVTEAVVLTALSAAAVARERRHSVILMVELGDLREGVAADQVVDLARFAGRLPGLRVAGIGTNLACQSGVEPDQEKMDELSRLADQVEAACGIRLSIVSGGNSANLDWAFATGDVGRVDELRLGESILLGREPLHRTPVDGLRTDAFTLVAEVIEAATKPARPWGRIAQAAFGALPVGAGEGVARGTGSRTGTGSGPGTVRSVILALGRQDVDPAGIMLPEGYALLGMSSDHTVVDIGDHDLDVGDELTLGLDYSALVRAATSPFVTTIEHRAPVVGDGVTPAAALAS